MFQFAGLLYDRNTFIVQAPIPPLSYQVHCQCITSIGKVTRYTITVVLDIQALGHVLKNFLKPQLIRFCNKQEPCPYILHFGVSD
jgi:hypothetical protein